MTAKTLSFNIDAIIAGQSRLTDAQALELYHHASMHDLGQWAHAVTQRMHPRGLPHLRHRPQHQLHQRLHRQVHVLRLPPRS